MKNVHFFEETPTFTVTYPAAIKANTSKVFIENKYQIYFPDVNTIAEKISELNTHKDKQNGILMNNSLIQEKWKESNYNWSKEFSSNREALGFLIEAIYYSIFSQLHFIFQNHSQNISFQGIMQKYGKIGYSENCIKLFLNQLVKSESIRVRPYLKFMYSDYNTNEVYLKHIKDQVRKRATLKEEIRVGRHGEEEILTPLDPKKTEEEYSRLKKEFENSLEKTKADVLSRLNSSEKSKSSDLSNIKEISEKKEFIYNSSQIKFYPV
ncbi:MAG: hypothetical protein IT287_07325 [Bdellovibrionaceae bacterium]|nr:hypothetical protein [Pseudobdellovibrionaceae bacterium]